MTTKQALTEARKRWGKNAAIEFDKRSAYAPERQKASDTHKELRAKLNTLQKDDPKYKVIKRECDIAQCTALHCPYKVGAIVMGMFFHIHGDGDSWEEAFAKTAGKICV